MQKERQIEMIIEREDGSTYKQRIMVPAGKDPDKVVQSHQAVLGKSYYICAWYEV